MSIIEKIISYFYVDQEIARGILKSMNIKSVSDIIFSEDSYYSFLLEGFNIKVFSSDLYVDDVELRCTDDICFKIYLMADRIHKNDEIENARMIRKDAFIKFSNK